MRILYHHRTASNDGQAVHIGELVGALRALGHEVRVVGPPLAQGRAMGADVDWVQRLKARVPRPAYELLELAYSLVALTRLVRAARAFRPDAIYERYNVFMLGGLAARRLLRVPLLLEVNSPLAAERASFGGLALRRLAFGCEARVWRGADAVLPVTRVLAREVVARGVPEARVTVIHNGVNEAHFAGALAPDAAKAQLGLTGRLVLGFTGFIRDWHGVDRVVRWLAGAQVPAHVHLLVVGDGPARAVLERLAAELGVAGRVSFTGVVERARIPDHVNAFDVALQPSVVSYASPLKLFEYLALGKAIVAPRQPNVEEVLTDGVNALLFDPADEASLGHALDRLVGDGALRATLSANAARTIAERGYTWLGNARRVAALCDRLAAPAPRGDCAWPRAD